MRILLSIFLMVMSVSACKAEPSDDKLVQTDTNIRTQAIAGGLDHPWSVEFLDNGEFLITERSGQLLRVSKDGEKTEISGLPEIYNKGQGGLLDVIATDNNIIYFSYSGADAQDPDLANTEVARARLNLENNSLEDMRVIFKATPKVEGNNHWGSRLLKTSDDALYVTLGERFDYRDQAQNPDNHIGTIVRITDNDTSSEVYSYGHRNVQGIAMNPVTGEIWAHEHGPKGGDEVNILKPSRNYGWPNVSYGRRYSGREISETGEHAPDYEGPVLHWTPSIAPSGMMFYTGDKFPEWQNDLFVGALAGEHLRRVELNGTDVVEQEELLKDLGARIRDVAQGPDGYIYVLTDSDQGKLLKLTK